MKRLMLPIVLLLALPASRVQAQNDPSIMVNVDVATISSDGHAISAQGWGVQNDAIGRMAPYAVFYIDDAAPSGMSPAWAAWRPDICPYAKSIGWLCQALASAASYEDIFGRTPSNVAFTGSGMITTDLPNLGLVSDPINLDGLSSGCHTIALWAFVPDPNGDPPPSKRSNVKTFCGSPGAWTVMN